MGKRGPPKIYPHEIRVKVSAEMLALLDKLRGKLTRSEAIRTILEQAAKATKRPV